MYYIIKRRFKFYGSEWCCIDGQLVTLTDIHKTIFRVKKTLREIMAMYKEKHNLRVQSYSDMHAFIVYLSDVEKLEYSIVSQKK